MVGFSDLPDNADELSNPEEEKNKWSKVLLPFLFLGFSEGINLAGGNGRRQMLTAFQSGGTGRPNLVALGC